jgi:acyl transferase domain-containing protein
MDETRRPEVAVVGLGAILPDAPDAPSFWRNVKEGRYSITEVPKERWDPDLYYDPDPRAPDKTYSKIGGWVREGEWDWDPFGWHLPIPPTVGDSMEDSQKWAIACARQALADYGYPGRPLDTERTAVILGNALAGDRQFATGLRILYPEFAEELAHAPTLLTLPPEVRTAILEDVRAGMARHGRDVTGDTVLGELSNILAGRVANLFDLHGTNCTIDAACGSALAAMNASVKGLIDGDFDVAITGGVDTNMGPIPYVKFSKLGALSATGTRPYDEGADGFVMGEGAALFLLKRLADAEAAGDRIYAVIRGMAGSSDGKGRGLTAPNPVGQRLAVQWAWERAGVSPATAGLIEGHGTSTALGDVVEVECLQQVFGPLDLPTGSIALGSAKSNIGHLKAAAGAAGLLKAVLALHEKVLPPSLNFHRPNPNIDWAHSPFSVNTELREWEVPAGGIRRAGVSAFGFGGTNFHAVLDEYAPGASKGSGRRSPAATEIQVPAPVVGPVASRSPLRGALVIGADSTAELANRLRAIGAEVAAGRAPAVGPPPEADLRAPERVAIDFGDGAELKEKVALALHALAAENRAEWRALRGRGIFRGSGPAPKVAFLYTGQGSQYVNMLATLRASENVVREVFDEADRVMTPLLGESLSRYIFVEDADPRALDEAEAALTETDVTQPAVLAADLALDRLLAGFGISPDMVMGHSMGEYAALVAAGCLTFENAARAVSARGRAVANLAVEDRGRMAAVFAPPQEVERILRGIDGYVIVANFNSNSQAVISGAGESVERAAEAFEAAGHRVVMLPISHAFHTRIVAPATEPLRRALEGLDLRPTKLPIVADVSGEFYPSGPNAAPQMLDMLAAQIASPVQFVKGLQTLYEAGARVFVEVGPKSALHGFVEDVLGDRTDVLALFTNHPKPGDLVSFNHALCGLYAAGLGAGETRGEVVIASSLGIRTEERGLSGGVDSELATQAAQPGGATGPMVGRVTGMSAHDGLTVETVLDPKAQAFLWDHRMDGTALLPGVMGAEAFAEAALLPLPGWHVAAVEDMRFQAPFKFYRDEPRTLLLSAVFRPDGQDILAECRLTGQRALPVRAEPLVTTHFTGKVRLTRAPLAPPRIGAVRLPEGRSIEAADIYRVYFHGPSYQVLARAWPPIHGGPAIGMFAEDLPPDHVPADAPFVVSPRLIELCFQTIGVWELATVGRFALPHSFERVTSFGGAAAWRAPLVAVVTARDGGESFDAIVADADGVVCMQLEGYRSVELPGAIAPAQAQIFQAAAA